MTRVPIPEEDAKKISERAAVLARENIGARGWSSKSVASIQADGAEGKAGLKSTVDYVMIQNKGFKSFVMWWAEGRVIPIHDSSGTHMVTAKGVGQPGFVTLPGGVKKWRDAKWKHPGLEPKNFIEDALTKAIEEYKHPLRAKLLGIIQKAMGK